MTLFVIQWPNSKWRPYFEKLKHRNKYWKNGKNTGKVREICQSGNVGTLCMYLINRVPRGLGYDFGNFTAILFKDKSVYALRIKHHLPIRMSDSKINLPGSKITHPDFCSSQLMSCSCSSWQIYGLVESWSDFTASRSEILRCDIAFF